MTHTPACSETAGVPSAAPPCPGPRTVRGREVYSEGVEPLALAAIGDARDERQLPGGDLVGKGE